MGARRQSPARRKWVLGIPELLSFLPFVTEGPRGRWCAWPSLVPGSETCLSGRQPFLLFRGKANYFSIVFSSVRQNSGLMYENPLCPEGLGGAFLLSWTLGSVSQVNVSSLEWDEVTHLVVRHPRCSPALLLLLCDHLPRKS